jgi:hypothetical protein
MVDIISSITPIDIILITGIIVVGVVAYLGTKRISDYLIKYQKMVDETYAKKVDVQNYVNIKIETQTEDIKAKIKIFLMTLTDVIKKELDELEKPIQEEVKSEGK